MFNTPISMGEKQWDVGTVKMVRCGGSEGVNGEVGDATIWIWWSDLNVKHW